ncbi:hypothetical protein FHT78_005422 [Rhizobium sp. BK196]|uniref:DUF7338 family protein n=1 Tax=Rhizobium sp. BK196 TaxID=2587073 RepID=UPI0017CE4919|nr:hypothetical protein [Rhizobium sp. BK196]
MLLAFVLSPLLAALSLLTGPKLPGFLQWFSTTDADLDGGIAQNVAGYKDGLKGWRLWWQRTCWICRNPAHGWQAEVLGMSTDGLVTLQMSVEKGRQWFLFKNSRRQKFFCIKRDVPLFGSFYIKLYLGWYDVARDGRNHQYEFQIGLKQSS